MTMELKPGKTEWEQAWFCHCGLMLADNPAIPCPECGCIDGRELKTYRFVWDHEIDRHQFKMVNGAANYTLGIDKDNNCYVYRLNERREFWTGCTHSITEKTDKWWI